MCVYARVCGCPYAFVCVFPHARARVLCVCVRMWCVRARLRMCTSYCLIAGQLNTLALLLFTRQERQNYFRNMKTLATNPHFMLILTAFGCGYGVFQGLATVMNQLLTPQGYTTGQAGIAGVILILAGIVSSMIAGRSPVCLSSPYSALLAARPCTTTPCSSLRLEQAFSWTRHESTS
jgi:hypothetical protein